MDLKRECSGRPAWQREREGLIAFFVFEGQLAVSRACLCVSPCLSPKVWAGIWSIILRAHKSLKCGLRSLSPPPHFLLLPFPPFPPLSSPPLSPSRPRYLDVDEQWPRAMLDPNQTILQRAPAGPLLPAFLLPFRNLQQARPPQWHSSAVPPHFSTHLILHPLLPLDTMYSQRRCRDIHLPNPTPCRTCSLALAEGEIEEDLAVGMVACQVKRHVGWR